MSRDGVHHLFESQWFQHVMTVRTKLNPNIGNRVFSAHEAVKIASIVIFNNLLLSQYARFFSPKLAILKIEQKGDHLLSWNVAYVK